MNTTLEQIKANNPCETSYKKLLKGLNKTKADKEPLEFRTIYNILDADDLFWSTRVLNKKTRVYVGALFADTVKHLTEDKRVHNCIEVCFRYARGEATEKELKNAASAFAAFAADADASAAYAATYAAADYAAYAAYSAYNATNAAYTASDEDTYEDNKDKLALMFLTYIEEV